MAAVSIAPSNLGRKPLSAKQKPEGGALVGAPLALKKEDRLWPSKERRPMIPNIRCQCIEREKEKKLASVKKATDHAEKKGET